MEGLLNSSQESKDPGANSEKLEVCLKNCEVLIRNAQTETGDFHDQADAKWIVIRGPLTCHNDMPYGRPNPGRPVGHPLVGRYGACLVLLVTTVLIDNVIS
jgi:hypothetical protein